MIKINQLKKSYGDHFSLSNVNLEVDAGKVFALVGPNGAGKTTLVKCLLNLMMFDEGKVQIDQVDVNDPASRIHCAFVQEKFNFFPYYTAESILTLYAKMRLVPLDLMNAEIDQALKKLHIYDLKLRQVKSLSKGQLQRIGLASLFIGKPKLIILDEPFSGLDPQEMKDLKELILQCKENGQTVFMNSHILSEVEQICDEVALINKGTILSQKSMEQIKNEYQSLENFFTTFISREDSNV